MRSYEDIILDVEERDDPRVGHEQLLSLAVQAQPRLEVLFYPRAFHQTIEAQVDVSGVAGLGVQQQVEEVLRVWVVSHPPVREQMLSRLLQLVVVDVRIE